MNYDLPKIIVFILAVLLFVVWDFTCNKQKVEDDN